MSAYKEVLDGMDLKSLIKGFWIYEAPTPEEQETINDCKHVKYIKVGDFNVLVQ